MGLCAVYGCSNRSKTSKKRKSAVTNLYRLPSIVHNQCDRTKALSVKRRRLWLTRIRRADLNPDRGDVRVCGAHFVSGRPSKLWEETNPDWAPTLLLGYSTCHEDPAPYDRMNIERLQKDEADVAAVVESIGTGSNNAVEGQPPSEDESHMERNKPGLTATVICPATQKHVDKYLFKPQHMITETPKLYKEVTEPYITSQQLSLQWVYNILEHKKESERILFEDPDPETGFILLPDMKWDTKQPENLYVLAICHKHGIRSLRDLTADHLSLLRNINEKVKAALLLQFGVPSHRLRGYLHYQPSYYHLHVHFSVLGFDAPGTQVERAHLLSTVISNLEAFPDYYQKATLGFTVKEGDGLHAKYKEAGYFD
uniref:m7GpppX diphosphatase n=1 Tax=Rhipicephalus zambeziensis TaxID=60191 RepID=A0A224Z1A2_9ACAR